MPQVGAPVSFSNCAPEAFAPSCALKVAASADAIRSGGLVASVPCAVDAAGADVGLSEPQPVSNAAANATPREPRNRYMTASTPSANADRTTTPRPDHVVLRRARSRGGRGLT